MIRNVLSDIANQVVILAARFEVLAKLAVFLASAFSVVAWAQGLLASDFFELFNHKFFSFTCQKIDIVKGEGTLPPPLHFAFLTFYLFLC